MKKISLFIFIIFTLSLLLNINVDAAKIKIVKDPNSTWTGILSIDNNEYSIKINEETRIGYVIFSGDNNYHILGTCTVIVFDFNNSYCNILSNAEEQEDNLGTIKIVMDKYSEYSGVINDVDGEIEKFIFKGLNIVFE